MTNETDMIYTNVAGDCLKESAHRDAGGVDVELRSPIAERDAERVPQPGLERGDRRIRERAGIVGEGGVRPDHHTSPSTPIATSATPAIKVRDV